LTHRPFLSSIIVILIVAAAYAEIRFKRAGLTDFVVPRTAAARFLAHEPLYRPEDGHYQFKYLPAFAFLVVPFAWMSKELAEAVWFTLSVLMAWAFVRWTVRALPGRRMPLGPLVGWTLLLNAKFLLKELGFGQSDLPLALLYWAAILSDRRDRAGLGGALLAAGAFFKPYSIVLLPWLVWTQRRRSLITFVAVLAAGLALPAVAYGWDGNLALLNGWYRTVTGTTGPNLASYENVSFAAFWARWLPPGAGRAALALVSVAVAMIAGLALMWQRPTVREPEYLEGAYFAALIPLVSPQGWDYLLLVALPGYACLVDRWPATSTLWRAVTVTGFLLTSFGTYELMRRTVYFHLMGWGAGTVGAALIAASLFQLRWRKLA
jgi:glycosyl transferase family 87